MEVLLCLFVSLCNTSSWAQTISTLAHSSLVTTEPPAAYLDDGERIWGYFTPWGLGIPVALFVALIVATGVACLSDFRNGSKGVKQDIVAEPDVASPSKKIDDENLVNITQESIHQSAEVVSANEIEAEATQISRIPERESSARLDPHEKHVRIIEAIYHASGRELPQVYRSSLRRSIFLENTQPLSGARDVVDNVKLAVINENEPGEQEVSAFNSPNSTGTLAKSATPSPMPEDAKKVGAEMGLASEKIGSKETSEAVALKSGAEGKKLSAESVKASHEEQSGGSKETMSEIEKVETLTKKKEDTKLAMTATTAPKTELAAQTTSSAQKTDSAPPTTSSAQKTEPVAPKTNISTAPKSAAPKSSVGAPKSSVVAPKSSVVAPRPTPAHPKHVTPGNATPQPPASEEELPQLKSASRSAKSEEPKESKKDPKKKKDENSTETDEKKSD